MINEKTDAVAVTARPPYLAGHILAKAKREEAEEKGIVGQAEIIIAKQRNGPIGDVKLAWLGQYTLFANLAETNPVEYEEFTHYQDSSGFGHSDGF